MSHNSLAYQGGDLAPRASDSQKGLAAKALQILRRAFPSATAAPSSSSVATAAADVFTLAAGEVGVVIDLGTNPLFVRRATGATTSAFHYVLQAAGSNDDGTGGAVVIDDHVGVVSVAGTSPRYIAWKTGEAL